MGDHGPPSLPCLIRTPSYSGGHAAQTLACTATYFRKSAKVAVYIFAVRRQEREPISQTGIDHGKRERLCDKACKMPRCDGDMRMNQQAQRCCRAERKDRSKQTLRKKGRHIDLEELPQPAPQENILRQHHDHQGECDTTQTEA